MNTPGELDRQASLRREVRLHWILSAAFTLMTVGAALVFIDRWLTASITLWYAAINAVSGLGFLSLIVVEARAAIRASRELAEERRLLNGEPS